MRKAKNMELVALREVISRRRPELLPILEPIEKGDRLREADRELLREVIAEEFVETGLDPDDEPTSRGLMLEGIIDWLGHR